MQELSTGPSQGASFSLHLGPGHLFLETSLLHLLIPPVHGQLSLPCSSLGLSPGYSLFSDHDFKVPVPGFPCSHHCLVVPQDPVWMSSLLTVLTLWGLVCIHFLSSHPQLLTVPLSKSPIYWTNYSLVLWVSACNLLRPSA